MLKKLISFILNTPPEPASNPKDLIITEGVGGVWHYHLSRANSPSNSLCERFTMKTNLAFDDWQRTFGDHFAKKPTWCEVCDRIRTEEKHGF